MRTLLRTGLLALGLLGLAAAVGLLWIRGTGFSARTSPGPFETSVARGLRELAIPAAARERQNPVPAGEETLREGLEHFADHCAICHANDGSGEIELGRSLYPPAPDMQLAATQSLTDGELFYIIENGVPFTGMPAWSTGTEEGESASWHLVHFIRHLPNLTAEELARMEELNPRSPEEIRQEIEIERFLSGEVAAPSTSGPGRNTHDHEEE